VLQENIKTLFQDQLKNWNLARTNYEGLKTIQTKSFNFGDFEIKVQFNPARITSTGAKTDAKNIAERKCFLCRENLPGEQMGIEFGDYTILVNPFPILPEHFTIPYKNHIPQQIKPHFSDMLKLAKELSDYVVFYNGPKCGASAPDHMHFQAGTKGFLPLVNDYNRLKDTHTDLLVSTNDTQLFQMKNYLRTVYCIESKSVEGSKDAFEKLYSYFQNTLVINEVEEPMMNIVCVFQDNRWFAFILPRKAFRPWQYTAEAEKQLLISPATVELSGIFIAPIEEHFDRISEKDIESILEQTSLK